MLKKRRIDDDGKFKIVIQKQRAQKREDAEDDEGVVAEEGIKEQGRKRRKTSAKENECRILGEVIRGAELAEKVDWEERRREILENLRKEEEERVKKIEKAQRLSRGWELNRLCREIIKENVRNWDERDEKLEREKVENVRRERIEKAERKKQEFREKRETNRKITEMLESIVVSRGAENREGNKEERKLGAKHHEKESVEKVERKDYDRG